MVPWAHVSQFHKRHLDQSSYFCWAQLYAQHTDIQTMLHVTSVATGYIYEVHAGTAAYSCIQSFLTSTPSVLTLSVGDKEHPT